MTGTDVDVKRTPQQEFEQRIKDRLAEDMGKLMPDEVLAEMVNRAMNDAFFKERVVERDGYNRTTVKPPWFVEAMRELLEEQVKAQCATWFEKNQDTMEELVRDLVQDGLLNAIINRVNTQLQFTMDDFANKIVDRLRSGM